MRPKILITPSLIDQFLRLNVQYAAAISESGGFPLILSYQAFNFEDIDDLLSNCEGILLSGGDDIHPDFFPEGFREPIHPKAEGIRVERDRFEIMLVKEAMKRDLPLLGICRGMQLLNVALGGTLHQHIEDHSLGERSHELVHEAKLAEGSKLAEILGADRIGTNSSHHQAVNQVAPILKATAWAEDGIVEAIEHPDKAFAIGVQWHPELLIQNNQEARKIFEAFVGACVEKRR